MLSVLLNKTFLSLSFNNNHTFQQFHGYLQSSQLKGRKEMFYLMMHRTHFTFFYRHCKFVPGCSSVKVKQHPFVILNILHRNYHLMVDL